MNDQIEAFRGKLETGHLCLGSAVTFTDPGVTEALAGSVDFFWIDLEHTPLLFESLTSHLIAARAGGTPCIVRVPSGDVGWIKKTLDCGADGIILPRANGAEDVREFVSACRYPPLGTRGYGPRRPTEYARREGAAYVEWANRNLFVIAQIETAGALDEIDAIVAIEGLDSIVLGPYDLSGSIDELGAVEGPVVMAALKKIVTTARAAGKYAGCGCTTDIAFVRKMVDLGVQWAHVGCDFEYMHMTAERIFDQVRGGSDTAT